MKIYINCRSQKTLHPTVLESLRSQSVSCDIEFIESQSCPTRLSLLKKHTAGAVLFIDEDVVLPRSDFLKEVSYFLDNNKNIQFLTGHYKSDPSASYLQKSYNWISNLWALPMGSGVTTCQNASGGFWVVRSEVASVCNDWSEPTAWGGEDTRAVRYLQSKGVKIYASPKFGVLHYPRSNLSWFLRRAIQQGKAKQKWNLKSEVQSSQVWTQLTKNLKYMPALFLHQFAVVLGVNLERIRSWQARITPTKPDTK